MIAGRITNLDTQSSCKKSRENWSDKRGSRSSLLKKLERLVNKELPNKTDKGHFGGEGV
jgi:hypothetical protein